MVRMRGFEPPTFAFQVRSSGLSELHPVELAFPTGIEPAYLPVRSRALVQLSYGKNWYDVWNSNPCCCAENADAWPLARSTVPAPRFYSRIRGAAGQGEREASLPHHGRTACARA